MQTLLKKENRHLLEQSIDELGPWFHNISVIEDVETRVINPAPGPQSLNHPASRWEALEPHLPKNMANMNVLDVGSADGFFTLEFAKRGASVVANDSWSKMTDRIDFLAKLLGLEVKTVVGAAEEIVIPGEYDYIFNLGLLYHSRHPLLLLENLAKISCDSMYLETTVSESAGSHMLFKPPQEGVHHIPKWFPTRQCVLDMLSFVGYQNIEVFDYHVPGRMMLLARK